MQPQEPKPQPQTVEEMFRDLAKRLGRIERDLIDIREALRKQLPTVID